MLVLGIDPGSIKTGWALLKAEGRKARIVSSGTLAFDSKADFLDRLSEIKTRSLDLVRELRPEAIALESLIYVKSPQALIKLAQTRGVIISAFADTHKGKIFEYSPNMIKSVTVGHGHADKASIQKFLDMTLGKREYSSHDESDAVAIALCHIIAAGGPGKSKAMEALKGRNASGNSLAKSLAHKIN